MAFGNGGRFAPTTSSGNRITSLANDGRHVVIGNSTPVSDSVGTPATSTPPVPSPQPAPPAPSAPTINDLRVTPAFASSEYGKMIPIIHGSDKLTGNVIWKSDIREGSFEADGEIQTLSYQASSDLRELS